MALARNVARAIAKGMYAGCAIIGNRRSAAEESRFAPNVIELPFEYRKRSVSGLDGLEGSQALLDNTLVQLQ